ncbi:bifunctional 4-hydroxy-2-oxoglutarate aldolase/2-dehydro-3-deoxy-phosphogluconate aldolase [Verrucomicrobium spinosum]|uniref:bifunctional 4-hydroxy-2-oxoglutarate aldolase/2-dehydro-3-deoxy-phosphogluconate aldolase n=1 Tax=Verrucomicrobium spinosum TaxID=2736 RepID=UPI0009ECB593|nr:hypothetical protein [Verrucomicrobium spinosum]
MALEVLRRMASIKESLLLGAGTVLNIEQADEAIAAGAKYIVSPGMDEGLIRHCQSKNVPIIPGACTPTEVMLAVKLGLECVKFFPSSAYGGITVIKALHGPFPQMRFLPPVGHPGDHGRVLGLQTCDRCRWHVDGPEGVACQRALRHRL